MGKKRKNEDSEERIRRKIRKWNQKLKKRQRIFSSDDEDSNYSSDEQHDCAASPVASIWTAIRSSHDEIEHTPTGTHLPATQVDAIDTDLEVATESPAVAENSLDTDILEILGEAPAPENTFGKPVHKDIAARWLDIVKKGLSKEAKEKLAKEYLIPANCELLVPPILNPEAKAALTENFVKRDSSLMYRQKQISNALAALAPALEIIISKDFDQNVRPNLLKPVSDACRILCDMHHAETKIRKKFVVSSISTGLKDTLSSANTDKYLFGDNMSDKIKNAKNVQKSGEALKIAQKPQQSYPKGNFQNRSRLNSKPLQKLTGKQDAGRSQSAPRQYQQKNSRAPPRRVAQQCSPPPSPPRRRIHARRER